MSDSVRAHAGWAGQFTTHEHPGALPNGMRIRKAGNPTGSTGRILGSMAAPAVGIGYFVEWDHLPQTAVFIMARKIEPIPLRTERKATVHIWPSGTRL
jgi:hypothetical protein